MGNPHWSRLKQELWPVEKSPQFELVFRQDMSPTGDVTGWNYLFQEDCTPQKGPVLDQLIKDCLKQRRGNRDKVLQSDHNPPSTAHCITPAEDVEESGAKLSFGRRKE